MCQKAGRIPIFRTTKRAWVERSLATAGYLSKAVLEDFLLAILCNKLQ